MTPALRIEKLRGDHPLDGFDCGAASLNRFLARYALLNQQAGGSRTYVALDGERAVDFHTLVVGEIASNDAAERLRKGLARHPVPIMLLARLAVSLNRQGDGLGGGLLKDAVLRTLRAAEIAGIRALVAHAKDERARRFYERYDFTPSPSDPLHLFVLLKDAAPLAGGAPRSQERTGLCVEFPYLRESAGKITAPGLLQAPNRTAFRVNQPI